MAYAPKDLSVLAYANGFTLWHYCTNDAAQAVVAPDYFSGGAYDLLRVGDMILVNAGPAHQREGAVMIVSGSDHKSLMVAVTSLTPLASSQPVMTAANDGDVLHVPATGTR